MTDVPARFSPSGTEWQRPPIFDDSRRAEVALPGRRPQSVEFCPTILGGFGDPKVSRPDQGGVVFADHYSRTAWDYAPSYRSAIIGGAGVVGAIILFFVGDAVLTNRVQSKIPGSSAAGTTISRQQPQPEKKPAQAKTASSRTDDERAELATEQAVPKSIDELLKRDARGDEIQPKAAAIDQPKAAAIKKSPPEPVEKPETSLQKSVDQSKTPKSPVARSAKTSQGPSTLVISSQNGKVTSRYEGATGASRPRIVGNPSN
jgi:hypothetical protein